MLNKRKEPLPPVHNVEARLLLSKGLAVVHKRFPFVIRLKYSIRKTERNFTIKIDPGSKQTGFYAFFDSVITLTNLLSLHFISKKGE